MKTFTTAIAIVALILALPAGHVQAAQASAEAASLAYIGHNHPPDTRVQTLRTFLERYNSPLAQSAETFVEQADRHNIDWKLVAAIAGVESTFGKHIPPGSYNAWGWGIPTGAQSGIGFESWDQGIATVSRGLATNYFGRGAKTLYDVGWIYAANGNSWGNHTRFWIEKIASYQPETPDLLAVSI